MSYKKEMEITFDEFAEAEEAATDEWIDRHGVDRSPDAEADRVDKAYERMRDEQIAIADRDAEETIANAFSKEFQPDVYGVWKIAAGTEVFVSDKKGQLRGHRMKKDAVYGVLEVMGVHGNQSIKFSYPMTIAQPSNTHLSTSLAYLVSEGWVVVATGLKRWPFIIVKKTAVIVVYESAEVIVGNSGGTCRKLGY